MPNEERRIVVSKARATADIVVTSVFVSCTLGMAFFCVGGHFWPAGETGSSPVVENWRGVREFGILLGQADAPLVVTAFMDFTCPFSRSLALVTDSLLRQIPNDVALAFLHFPLQGRTPSPPPAVALE